MKGGMSMCKLMIYHPKTKSWQLDCGGKTGEYPFYAILHEEHQSSLRIEKVTSKESQTGLPLYTLDTERSENCELCQEIFHQFRHNGDK